MNFAIFNLMFFVAGFLAVFVFSLGVMACLAPLGALSAGTDSVKGRRIPVCYARWRVPGLFLGILGSLLRRTYHVLHEES